MLAAAHRFCEDMLNGHKPRWLTFLGISGIGKTFLSEMIWRFFQEQGQWYKHPTGANLVHYGRKIHWPIVVDRMKPPHSTGYSTCDDLKTAWFAIIDDIGSEHDPSKNGSQQLCQICSMRLRDENRWTVFSSNKSLGQIESDMDRRIASRLVRDGNEVLTIDTMDYSLRDL